MVEAEGGAGFEFKHKPSESEPLERSLEVRLSDTRCIVPIGCLRRRGEHPRGCRRCTRL